MTAAEDFEHLLDRTCTTQRAGRASDGQGGWTETYVDHLVDEPCRRRPAGTQASDQVVAEQLQAEIAHVVYWHPDADVRRGDRVLVDGYILRVEATTVPSVPAYLAGHCSEVQTG